MEVKLFVWRYYTSTKSWRGYIFTSVCLCVCLCVCVSGISCEQNSSRTDAPIWTRFSLNGCFLHWLGPYWIWWPWIKGQGHGDVIPIFLHNSLLTSLPCISALLWLIKMKFGMSVRYTLCRFVLKINKIWMGDDVIMTSFIGFLQTIVHISNSIEPKNFVLGTNTQQYKVHLMIKLKVTLTDNEGQMRRSKFTKMN